MKKQRFMRCLAVFLALLLVLQPFELANVLADEIIDSEEESMFLELEPEMEEFAGPTELKTEEETDPVMVDESAFVPDPVEEPEEELVTDPIVEDEPAFVPDPVEEPEEELFTDPVVEDEPAFVPDPVEEPEEEPVTELELEEELVFVTGPEEDPMDEPTEEPMEEPVAPPEDQPETPETEKLEESALSLSVEAEDVEGIEQELTLEEEQDTVEPGAAGQIQAPGSFQLGSGSTVWMTNVYAAEGTTTVINNKGTGLTARVKVMGEVVLELKQGSTLIIPLGIYVPKGSKLTITGSGTLYAGTDGNGGATCEKYTAGIGGGWFDSDAVTVTGEDCGEIVIDCDGTVVAWGSRTFRNKNDTIEGGLGAGIGGGTGLAKSGDKGQGGSGGTITILKGNVTAYGGQMAAGIGGGGGEKGGSGGTITINGGVVMAYGGDTVFEEGYEPGGAGIGGGAGEKGAASGTIVINGGDVTAKGGYCAAGIGGGYGGSAQNITIKGSAKVHAIGGGIYEYEGAFTSSGAGIGGGDFGNSGNILIQDSAEVIAEGGDSAAGIGGGCGGDGISIIIKDSTQVTATGGAYGAGIGGGAAATETTVSALKGGNGGIITIQGSANVEAVGGDGAAGIGGGNLGDGGTITIESGTVKATAGLGSAGIGGGAGYVSFDGEDAYRGGTGGSITIKGGKVTAVGGDTMSETSFMGGAGIGGGYHGAASYTQSSITISGGEVTATGGKSGGAGIGSGSEAVETGTILISGGTISADTVAGGTGAGIGSGYKAPGGTIHITGGTIVKAAGGNLSAGIGGSYQSSAGSINISGAADIKNASGGVGGAGIGGGANGTNTVSENWKILIDGTTSVVAWGGADFNTTVTENGAQVEKKLGAGAGIGGGQGNDGGSITIQGSTSIQAAGGTGTNGGAAGIGGGAKAAGGSITITTNGNIVAQGGQNSAGIGGGQNGAGGTIKISNATISAVGGDGGAGIGGGANNGGSITISSGIITATGNEGGAGIGGGNSGNGGSITISGGTISASGLVGGAGIGGGRGGAGSASGSKIEISGDTVITQASGRAGGAGIGGGLDGAGGTIEIAGSANVKMAKGGAGAAGIGGGENNPAKTKGFVDGGTITISGTAAVVAQGGGIFQEGDTVHGSGAGIGGGYGGSGGSITIKNDPSITAIGGWRAAGIGGGDGGTGGTILISGGTIKKAQGGFIELNDGSESFDRGAGIGGGAGCDGGSITISGGTILEAAGGTLAAGIGGGEGGSGGSITISGGTIQKAAGGETGGAGIGGGNGGAGSADNGQISISGGEIQNAQGGFGAAGIGGGSTASGGTITISGTAIVTAVGGEKIVLQETEYGGGAGIGGGLLGTGGKITISGGTVTASGGWRSAGIGSGQSADGGEIIISGGEVKKALGGYGGAGIGGGYYGKGGTILISAGTITSSKGGQAGAGIGGGIFAEGGQITISGGTILHTEGGTLAAGIGGGQQGSSGTIIIKGNAVIQAADGDYGALGGWGAAGIGGGLLASGATIDISGSAVVSAKGGHNLIGSGTPYPGGAGIGGGSKGAGGTISITGGTVEAAGDGGGMAIGAGGESTDTGTLSFGSFLAKVTAGADKASAVLADASERIQNCLENIYAKIELCQPHAFSAGSIITETHHSGNCRYCGLNLQNEAHRFIDGVCVCGAVQALYRTEEGSTAVKVCLPARSDVTTLSGSDWNKGWYVVTADTKIESRITVSGDVKLILTDGVTLLAVKGITVEGNSSLSIYEGKLGSSGTVEGSGMLTAGKDGNSLTCEDAAAGIGGTSGAAGGTVVIHGGTVAAWGGKGGAGIGGGNGGAGGTVTILGGTVEACGANGGMSIGHGKGSTENGTLSFGSYPVRVKAGTAPSNSALVKADERMEKCWSNSYAQIELCVDHVLDFEKAEATSTHHSGDCLYCGTQLAGEPHDFTNGVCACGAVVVTIVKEDDSLTETLCRALTDLSIVLNDTGWHKGWYAVCADTRIESRITVSGQVNLVLCDDVKLEAIKGITVENGGSLTIYAGSSGSGSSVQMNGTGVLIAGKDNNTLSCEAGLASIGGDGSTITIHGGQVTAAGADNAPGVGGTGSIINLNYAESVKETISVTASSYAGTVKLLKGFMDGSDGDRFPAAPTGVSDDVKNNLAGRWLIAEGVFVSPWQQLQNEINAASDGAVITLKDDVTALSYETALLVAADQNVVLDLNGHSINRGLSESTAVADGHVISVLGKLTVTDNTQAKNGQITGGNNTASGGGVVVTGGTFRLEGGSITGNQAGNGGGVYLSEGSFELSGAGIVAGNVAGNGGGIFMDGGSFVMNGGTVKENTANSFGGGIYLSKGSFDLSGDGRISDNKAQNGGGVFAKADFSLSGAAKVEGNQNANSKPSNILLYCDAANLSVGSQTRIKVSDALTGTSTIGISYWFEGIGASEQPEVLAFTSGLSGNGEYTYFTSDLEGYTIGKDADGEGLWGKTRKVTLAAGTGGSLAVDRDPAEYLKGETVTLTVTVYEASTLTSLTYTEEKEGASPVAITSQDQNGHYVLTMPANNITIRAEFDSDMFYLDVEGNSHKVEEFQFVGNDTNILENGWYAVYGDVTVDSTLEVTGNKVNLILCDNSVLHANQTVHVPEGMGLTIWAQSTGDLKGRLEARDRDGSSAAIGGLPSESAGTIIINGGTIDARTSGYYAAPIGGGHSGNGGTIIINAGTIEAINTQDRDWADHASAAGIGGGQGGDGGTIIINGGKIHAVGNRYAAGIGGGTRGGSGQITINGGEIDASTHGGNSACGAGIGSGERSSEPVDITITGGTIFAYGGGYGGAGIGGGFQSGEGKITISGGTITARGGNNGGIVPSGAGIGSGNQAGTPLDQTLEVFISGGEIDASAAIAAAGIGGGGWAGGVEVKVTITGGTIKAQAGRDFQGYPTAVAIGKGCGGTNETHNLGEFSLGDYAARVMAGDNEGNAVLARFDERATMCQTHLFAKIEPCTEHSFEGLAYDHDQNEHWEFCSVCGTFKEGSKEEHLFNSDGKCVCGYSQQTVTFPGVTNGEVSAVYGDAAFTQEAETDGNGVLHYSSSNTDVAEVDEATGEVTVKNAGEAVITAYVAPTYEYASNSGSYKLTVQKAIVTVTPDSQTKEYGEPDPELTYSYEGLLGSDTLSGKPDREAGEDSGFYAITLGTLTAGSNYILRLAGGATLTINKPPVGSLKIGTNVVSPVPADETKAFTFTVTLTSGEQKLNGLFGTILFDEDGKAQVTVAGGKTVTIPEIPVGTAYTVVQAEEEFFVLTEKTGDIGTIIEEGAEASFTNVRKTGSLEVSKTVVSSTASDKQIGFAFTMTLDDSTINGTFGDMTFKDGAAVFTLSDSQEIIASGLPAGVGYTVTEETADGFLITGKTGDTGIITETGSTVSFTNTRLEGSLVVSLNVESVIAADKDKTFAFTVTLDDESVNGTYGDMTFEKGIAVFTLKNGEQKTADCLKEGLTYTVTQTNDADFGTAIEGGTGKITSTTQAAVFTNTRKTGSLAVNKTVVSSTASDKQIGFAFTVTLDDSTINGAFGDMTFKNGAAVFTLSDSQEITASGLPIGVGYTVTEETTDGFLNTEKAGDTGTITETVSTASFTNTKLEGSLVVSLNVESVIASDKDKTFAFTVTLDDESVNGTYGDMTFENGVAVFTLKDGEQKTADGLAQGITYTVTQTDDADFDTATEGGTGTINATAQTAVFTNTRKTGSLEVSKTVVSSTASDKQIDFAFTVTLADSTINGAFGDMTFKDGTAAFTLSDSQEIIASGLPVSIGYTVTEETADGFLNTAKAGDTGTITETVSTASFTNTRLYTVTFETGDGSAVEAQTIAHGEKANRPADPVRDKYSFEGWYADEALAEAFDFDKAITEDLTVFAKWEPVIYQVISGGNSSYTRGSGTEVTVTVKRSAADDTCFSHFTGVSMDGRTLENGTDYDAIPGSTVITLKAETLNRLTVGDHTITILFDDNQVSTNLTVEASGEETSPNTGYMGGKGFWFALMILSGLFLLGLSVIKINHAADMK